MQRLAIAAGLGLLVGCASAQSTCPARGGRWYPSGVDPRLPGSCVMPAVDASQPCTHGDQCNAGYCACAAGGEAVRVGGSLTGECPEFPARAEDGNLCVVEHGLRRTRAADPPASPLEQGD